jgi:CDP-diacylglycerol--glycerol-3-phosphate 3-phosphatidyltransferase/cardiolipin synthase
MAIIWAGILLLCAWGTDALDGLLARKMNQSTLFGSIFDLVADRVVMTPILIITIIGGFWQRTSGIMLLNPYPYVIVVIIADMTILAGILIYLWKRRSRSMEFPRPTFVAKCTYSIQMLTLLIGVWGIGPNVFLGILMYLTIFVTLLAFYSYLRRGSYVFTS